MVVLKLFISLQTERRQVVRNRLFRIARNMSKINWGDCEGVMVGARKSI